MSHTPGPWEAVQWMGDKCTIAPEGKGGKFGFMKANTEANARLIAAAPELLEIARWAINQGDIEWDGRDMRKEAKAAIAKATGEKA